MSLGGNAGVEPGTSAAGDKDAAQLRTSSSDVNVTASDSNKQLNEGAPPLTIHSIIERSETPSFTKELLVSSPTSTGPMNAEFPTEFSHPAAVEEQRVIWLPKDPHGLVQDLEQKLASHDILYSSRGAKMDSQGKVTVTYASPEDVRRSSILRPREQREENVEGILSLWELVHDKCC